MCIITDSSELPLPENSTLLSDNKISLVYRAPDGYIYKRSTPYLTNNELLGLHLMFSSGFSPIHERYDKYTVKINDLGESEKVTNPKAFRLTCKHLLNTLKAVGLRHGDITPPHIIVKNNWPFLIDYAECRLSIDPSPDKRPEGDEYWLKKTVRELCKT